MPIDRVTIKGQGGGGTGPFLRAAERCAETLMRNLGKFMIGAFVLGLLLSGCADTLPITAPQVLPPTPRLTDVQREKMYACCAVPRMGPAGPILDANGKQQYDIKPGFEIVWEVLADHADYFNIINMGRAAAGL